MRKISIQYMVPGFKHTTFGREPLPITTRPGLPAKTQLFQTTPHWNNPGQCRVTRASYLRLSELNSHNLRS